VQPSMVMLVLVLFPHAWVRRYTAWAACALCFRPHFGVTPGFLGVVVSAMFLAMSTVNSFHYRDSIARAKDSAAVLASSEVANLRGQMWRAERDAWMAAFTLTMFIVSYLLHERDSGVDAKVDEPAAPGPSGSSATGKEGSSSTSGSKPSPRQPWWQGFITGKAKRE